MVLRMPPGSGSSPSASRWARAGTRLRSASRALACVVRRRGDRQLPADRLDPVLLTVHVDERRQVLGSAVELRVRQHALLSNFQPSVSQCRWTGFRLKLDQGAASTMTERFCMDRATIVRCVSFGTVPFSQRATHPGTSRNNGCGDGDPTRPGSRATSARAFSASPSDGSIRSRVGRALPRSGRRPGRGAIFAASKRLASLDRFFVNGAQELGNEPCGLRLLPKPEELRMADILRPFRPSAPPGRGALPSTGQPAPGDRDASDGDSRAATPLLSPLLNPPASPANRDAEPVNNIETPTAGIY